MAGFAWACALLVQAALVAGQGISCYDGKGSFTQANWPHCQRVHDSLLFYYGISADGDYLKLGLYASAHQGWSSLALAGNGGMRGSQSIVVRQVDGVFVAEERYTEGYRTPALQETQEVMLIFATEADGDTAWGVLLPMTSCQAGERYPIEDVSRWMLWSLGSSHEYRYHGAGSSRRGQFHANLVSGPKTPKDYSGLDEVTLRMPNVDVVMGQGGTDPSNPYVCSFFDLAEVLPQGRNIADKQHVVKMEAVLNPSNIKYLHHMLLYDCSVGLEYGMQYQHGGVVPDCESMPPGCVNLKSAWAVGSEPITFPDDVAMPFGQNIRWLALQMHYYNPDMDQGVKDNSGFTLTLANSMRTHDAALMAINGGTSDEYREPMQPGIPDLVLPTHVVPAQATQQMANDLNIVGVVYHGHLIGKSFNMEITNNGNYVGAIRNEKRYDFNHQSLEEPSINRLRRGDELTFTCRYDTTSRTGTTTFGDQTQTEMCWGAILYYPALPNFNECLFCGASENYRCTYCSGMDDGVWSEAPMLNPPQCQAKGNLSSSVAASLRQSMLSPTTTTTIRSGDTPTSGVETRSIITWGLVAALAGGIGNM